MKTQPFQRISETYEKQIIFLFAWDWAICWVSWRKPLWKSTRFASAGSHFKTTHAHLRWGRLASKCAAFHLVRLLCEYLPSKDGWSHSVKTWFASPAYQLRVLGLPLPDSRDRCLVKNSFPHQNVRSKTAEIFSTIMFSAVHPGPRIVPGRGRGLTNVCQITNVCWIKPDLVELQWLAHGVARSLQTKRCQKV